MCDDNNNEDRRHSCRHDKYGILMVKGVKSVLRILSINSLVCMYN